MQIYLYDKNTKEYTETMQAQKNPKREGEYLMPPNSTKEQLPMYEKDRETIVFEDHWVIKNDFRGQRVFDSRLNGITVVGYIGDIKEYHTLLDNEAFELYLKYPERFKVKNGKLIDIKGTGEFAKVLEEKFNEEFTQTDLGYIRKNTKWGNFLTIKPNYDLQFNQLGYIPADVLILYKKPDFFVFDSIEQMRNWLFSEGQYKNQRIEKEEYLNFSNQVLSSFMGEV